MPARLRSVILLFALGGLVVVPVGLAGVGVVHLAADFPVAYQRNLLMAFFGAALVEEIGRYCVLYFAGSRWIGFAKATDAVIFALVTSLGISCAENLVYGLSIGWKIGLFKFAVATPIHLALGVTMGSFVALAGARIRKPRLFMTLALAVPILLHGLYDFVVLTQLSEHGRDASSPVHLAMPATAYLIVIGSALIAGWRTRRTITASRSAQPEMA